MSNGYFDECGPGMGEAPSPVIDRPPATGPVDPPDRTLLVLSGIMSFGQPGASASVSVSFAVRECLSVISSALSCADTAPHRTLFVTNACKPSTECQAMFVSHRVRQIGKYCWPTHATANKRKLLRSSTVESDSSADCMSRERTVFGMLQRGLSPQSTIAGGDVRPGTAGSRCAVEPWNHGRSVVPQSSRPVPIGAGLRHIFMREGCSP